MTDTNSRRPLRQTQASRSQVGESVNASLVPLIASLAPWGVADAHWLPASDGSPVVWIRTGTRVERSCLEVQIWLRPQAQAMLSNLGVPHQIVSTLRVEITSAEDEASLFSP